jgi:putative DNA methylase
MPPVPRLPASRKLELGELKPDDKIGGATVFDIKGMLAKPEDVNAFLAEHAPPVLDPFCGGGSIPLEAQRLGLRVYASDLNPVAVLITKALIEIPPKFAGRPPVNPDWQKKGKQEKAATVWHGAQGLAADVRYYGQWMRDEAEKRIGQLYPKVNITKEMAKDRPDLKEYIGEELTVIAWLWARTIKCPNPACGATMPLVRSLAISTKEGKQAHVVPIIDASKNEVHFVVRTHAGRALQGTVSNRSVTCLSCNTISKLPYVRAEAKSGRMGSTLIASVVDGHRGRFYVEPSSDHLEIARSAAPKWKPQELVPTSCHEVDRLPMYGMNSWGDVFTPRQLVALTTFSDSVRNVRETVGRDASSAGFPTDSRSLADEGVGAEAYADALAVYLGIAVSRQTNTHCSLAVWSTGRDQSINAFGRQALPMTWDFPEVNPFAGAAGDLRQATESMSKVIELLPASGECHVNQLDAISADFNAQSVISTDPPYYDNIGYADLSDFFYVWLRRSIGFVDPKLFSTVLTPKASELIASPNRHNGNKQAARDFFENGLIKAFTRLREKEMSEVPFTVFYAFKQAETEEVGDAASSVTATASTGWETMLEGLINSGHSIVGTWPLRTERDQGLKSGTNVLASSIVLVCRKTISGAPLATRKQFITALRQELPDALRNLQHGNIAPVDLAQAAIGPGMAVFTRYAKVMETDGSAMSVRTALGLINQSLDEVLAEQEGEFDGETRWALAWFAQFGMEEGPFGVAETLSKAKNTAVNGLVEAGIVTARAGKVRLVGRGDLPQGWDPATERRLTVWETTQHLIRTLEQEGEELAATLMNKLGGLAETARDLAYRLFSICERNKWADEALAYNALVIAWPELTKLAQKARSRPPEEKQGQLGF